MKYVGPILLGLALLMYAVPRARAADALLVVQRPGEPESVIYRFTEMTACAVDLANERMLDRLPPGTVLKCVPINDRRSAAK